jgi:hypothetical protein
MTTATTYWNENADKFDAQVGDDGDAFRHFGDRGIFSPYFLIGHPWSKIHEVFSGNVEPPLPMCSDGSWLVEIDNWQEISVGYHVGSIVDRV